MSDNNTNKSWRHKLHEILYEADTPNGKVFNIVLFIVIIASIVFVMLESVESIDSKYHKFLDSAEWVITILFSLEYVARIITVKKPLKYAFSFFGIIDLLSTIPKYLSFFFIGSQSLVALRALRLLRVFRILKLARYIGESTNLTRAMKASRAKISVFILFVFILCIILGTIMYLIESGQDSGFTSIPRSVYWAIVTLTTVGYGDIAPVSALGQLISSFIMLMGYAILAVPTGIVSAEVVRINKHNVHTNTQSCPYCMTENHRDDAEYCHSCGNKLNE
ncbi:ion transporter [Flavobacteriaceae bacterium S0825]|uniref:ion transporter n=1 Tax=Gaetbulibacter sp. S0825 TaxID=2720084 RepID=UPI00142FB11C|nr:ion transporter [Gaetbulibacter sp. S0825]MCK0109195.1 ion transporter [Flavobacteriaceae bacterium S0825]NIX64830.1 ion transporter [Gaetbulibacter sp. S0825]